MRAEFFISNPLIGPDGKDYLSVEALLQARQEWNCQQLRHKASKSRTIPLNYPQAPAQELNELFLVVRRAIGQFPANKLVRTLEGVKDAIK